MSDMQLIHDLSPIELLQQYDLHNEFHWKDRKLSMSHPSPNSTQLSSYSSLDPKVYQREPVWQRIPCKSYENGRKADPSDIYFLCEDGSLVLASDALERRVQVVARGKFPDDIAAKVMIRIEFDDCATKHERQIMSRRANKEAEPISMQELVRKIAQEMEKFLDKAHEEIGGLTYKGTSVKLENLALIRLRRVSPGSWVPDFLLRLD